MEEGGTIMSNENKERRIADVRDVFIIVAAGCFILLCLLFFAGII